MDFGKNLGNVQNSGQIRMDKGFAIIFYFGNKKVVLFWERSLRRCRRGTQKLPGKRTGFGRRSEKAGRQRPTTEGATSQSGGNLSGNSTGAQNRKGRFCALFCCPKKETEERYSHHSEAMSRPASPPPPGTEISASPAISLAVFSSPFFSSSSSKRESYFSPSPSCSMAAVLAAM